ncbi:MAG: M48 family metalloprotease, partial [Aquabacterium sp.]
FIYRQRIAWGTIQQLAEQWEGRVGRWLATWVGRFAPYFNAYTFVLARANEYQADRASADLVGAAAAQAALKRVNVAGALHGDFMGRTYEGLRTLPEPPSDLTLRWADEARGSPALADAAPRWLANALDRRGAPMDTHPPLRQRLAALGDPAAVGTGTAEGTPAASPGAGLADPPVQIEPPAPLAGPSAAQAWLGTALPALREQLASAWADAVREGWAERHAQWTSGAARLAELRALPAPTPPEQLECLRLARSHEPQVDRREAAAAFTAAHPDEPGGWFVCAQVALDHDDPAAAATAFERAMALDADAIKPACDQMYVWLREHGDTAAAEPWAQRWRERDALEQQRTREFQALDPAHALAPREIPEPAAGELLQRILGAKRTGVRALYLVRRHLAADPALLTHVLVVDAGLWVRWRNTPHDLVKRYIDLEWPTAVLVTVPPRSWRGAWPAWWRTLRAMPGARIL